MWCHHWIFEWRCLPSENCMLKSDGKNKLEIVSQRLIININYSKVRNMSSSFFRLIVDDLHFILEIHRRFVCINRPHHFIQISNRIVIFKFCIIYHPFHLCLTQRKDNRLIHLFNSFRYCFLPLLKFLVFFF